VHSDRAGSDRRVGPGPMGPGLGHKRNREREARSLGISGSDFECKCHGSGMALRASSLGYGLDSIDPPCAPKLRSSNRVERTRMWSDKDGSLDAGAPGDLSPVRGVRGGGRNGPPRKAAERDPSTESFYVYQLAIVTPEPSRGKTREDVVERPALISRSTGR
jgi:hypothetical protein